MEHLDPPPADTKNWTWVLERPCPECGYRAEAVDRDEIGAQMRANAAGFRSALSRGEMVGRRPPVPAGSPSRWSAIEYACHVRDVYGLTEQRLTRMLKKKSPTFPDWDQDHAAIEGGYHTADPNKVSYELAAVAGRVADILDRVRGDKWDRTGTRSDGAPFTVESFARYMLHDVTHHLWDVEQGYQAIREADQPSDEAVDEGGNERADHPDEGR